MLLMPRMVSWTPLSDGDLDGTEPDPTGATVLRDGSPVGVVVDGVARAGFPTQSRRLEWYSATLEEWGWPEYRMPVAIQSHMGSSEPRMYPFSAPREAPAASGHPTTADGRLSRDVAVERRGRGRVFLVPLRSGGGTARSMGRS